MKFLKNIKTRSIFIALCTVGILVMVVTMGEKYQLKTIQNSVHYVIMPMQKGFNLITRSFDNVIMRFQEVSTLQEENKTLQEQVNELSYNNNILAQYKAENERLKQLLQLTERYRQYPSEGANIIAKEPGNWYNMFTIDKGTNLGVDANDTILAEGGLVGHVVESNQLSSKVLAIIDDRSAVSATVFRTGDIGILKGDIELIQQGLCKLQIDIQSEVIKGDQVVTSHLSAVYPPGIIIGIVEEVIIAQNGLTQYAYVRPIVNFKHLEQVLILKTKNSPLDQD